MYYFNKIVGFAVSPLGIAIGLYLAGALLAALRRRGWRRTAWGRHLAPAAFVWLWVWSMPCTSVLVGVPLERGSLVGGRVPPAGELPAADAILLFGGGMDCAESLGGHSEMWSGADRVRRAAELFRCGKAPRIYATGSHAAGSTGGLLAELGVPAAAQCFDEAPRNTEEEVLAAARRAERRVLVVTSAWHMPRTLMLFRKYAPELEVVPAAADFEYSVQAAKEWSPVQLLPDARALMASSVAFREYVGLVGYWLFR